MMNTREKTTPGQTLRRLGSVGSAAIDVCVDVPYAVVGIELRTPAISEVWLSPLAGRINYLPGQYVLLEDSEHRIAPRSYSLANAPRPDDAISLLVTRVPGGQTSCWVTDRLAVGDRVSLSGPYGTFIADPAQTGPSVYLAGGSGLAPIRALVEAALAADRGCRLTVVFSARTEADVLDRERFAHLEANHSAFRFVRTLTRGNGPAPHGRIPALLSGLCDDLAGHEVFIAGVSGFVLGCAAAAEAIGAEPARVHTEVFFAEPQP
jgi:CDP-4-dehydro-6-deoxyglucose reductase, E3